MILEDFLRVPYVANGRSLDGADCYGLVRLARVHLYGKELMPKHGNVEGSNKKALTKAMQQEAKNYTECLPKEGAIAAAFRGLLCTHIAIVVSVDGLLMILETDEPKRAALGARLTSIARFEQRFLKVVYYDN